MRSKPLAVACAFAALLSVAGPAWGRDLTAAERGKVVKAVRAYVREQDAARREKTWKGVAQLAERLSPEALVEVVREAVPGEAWKPGFHHDLAFEARGERWRYSAHVPRKRPGGAGALAPLVLDPGHASFADATDAKIEEAMSNWLGVSGATDDVVYVRTRVLDALSGDGRYDKWTAPRRPAGEANMDEIGSLLLAAVRDACLRFPVDPDRVYVQGLSQTGFWAWWLGVQAPDRFAAVVPVSSVTWHVRALLPNLLATPVFVLHGTDDAICPFAQAEQAVGALEELGAPVTFRPVQGGQHVVGTWARWSGLWPEVAERRRKATPPRVVKGIVSPARPAAFWLEARDVGPAEFNPSRPAARVEGRVEGQAVAVEASGCKALTVWLGPSMLDLGQAVTITVNGKKAFQGRVAPTPRRIADLARERGDALPHAVAVDVKVP